MTYGAGQWTQISESSNQAWEAEKGEESPHRRRRICFYEKQFPEERASLKMMTDSELLQGQLGAGNGQS